MNGTGLTASNDTISDFNGLVHGAFLENFAVIKVAADATEIYVDLYCASNGSAGVVNYQEATLVAGKTPLDKDVEVGETREILVASSLGLRVRQPAGPATAAELGRGLRDRQG